MQSAHNRECGSACLRKQTPMRTLCRPALAMRLANKLSEAAGGTTPVQLPLYH